MLSKIAALLLALAAAAFGQGIQGGGSSGPVTGCAASGAANVVQASNGSGGCQSTNITNDGTKTTFGAGSATAGGYDLHQGTAAGTTVGYVGINAPATVTTPYEVYLPAAPATGFILNTDTAGQDALSFVASTGSGSVVLATTPTLVTPVIGAATGTSLIATGIVDGAAPVTITTGTTATLGGTYSSGYTVNQNATAATAVAYTLPTAAAGKQYCVVNSYNGSAANTGVLTVNASAAGQFIIFTDGTLSATGGNVTSGGAARDSACFVGTDATHWLLYVSAGTWTKH